MERKKISITIQNAVEIMANKKDNRNKRNHYNGFGNKHENEYKVNKRHRGYDCSFTGEGCEMMIETM